MLRIWKVRDLNSFILKVQTGVKLKKSLFLKIYLFNLLILGFTFVYAHGLSLVLAHGLSCSTAHAILVP